MTARAQYEKGGRQKDFYGTSEVEMVSCPLCGREDNFRQIYRERGVLGVVRCLSCKLIFVNPRLKEPEKAYWGDSEKYFSEARMIFEGRASHHRDPNYEADLRLIRRYKPEGNFLDVGTNMGFFLRKAKGGAWKLYGVEPSPSLSEMARRYFGLEVKTAYLEDAGFPDYFFDVVSMTDVFEHIAQPRRILQEVRRILKQDGILFIKVPNGLYNLFKFTAAKITGRLGNYDIFDSYEHLQHYSQDTLGLMLGECGFRALGFFIGRPIQLPIWHEYVGQYYHYPSPWTLGLRRRTGRSFLYILSLLEYRLRLNRIGYLAPNIISIAVKTS